MPACAATPCTSRTTTTQSAPSSLATGRTVRLKRPPACPITRRVPLPTRPRRSATNAAISCSSATSSMVEIATCPCPSIANAEAPAAAKASIKICSLASLFILRPVLDATPPPTAAAGECFKIERYCPPNTIGQKPSSCEYMSCPASPSWRGDKSSSGPINLRTSHTRKSSYRSTADMRSPACSTQISYFSTRFPARAAFPNSCTQCQSNSKSPMRWACRPF